MSPGGPQLSGAFSYPVTRNLDVRIDLFAGGELLRLAGQPPLQSVTYGGQLGGRLSWPDPFGLGISPQLAVLLGPTLVYVSGGGLEQPSESLNTGLAAAAGLSWRLSALWCVELEYKHLLVRGAVPGIGSLNGGGNWFSVGVGRFFPP